MAIKQLEVGLILTTDFMGQPWKDTSSDGISKERGEEVFSDWSWISFEK